MNPGIPRQRREGWPWPAAEPAEAGAEYDGARRATEGEVNAAASVVAHLSDELRQALRRLEAAQQEARLAAESSAVLETERLLARAQRRVD